MNKPAAAVLPQHRGLYYGGAWHRAKGGALNTFNPGTGENLGPVAEADADDVDAAVRAANAAFLEWRSVKPFERGALLKQVARRLREHAEELAMLDAANCGNPVAAMIRDVHDGAAYIEYFAGLVAEAKGHVMPMGDEVVNMTVREPYGVVARIVAYNHPLMFAAMKIGCPLGVGNTVIIKPPPQAPLSALRMMELIDGILPPGVVNLVTGDRACGEALVNHRSVPVVSLVGSVESGRAVAQAAAARLKHYTLELGGKNAMIVYPDADKERAVEGVLKGMNFTWCGQSCGSTSRLFLHEDVYDQTLDGVLSGVTRFVPGLPTDMNTTMGAIVSQAQLDKVKRYVEIARADGAKLLYGGKQPDNPELKNGFYHEPTVFGGVDMSMRIAREEVFGPILSVFKWRDEERLFADTNAVDYGLTASIYTTNLANAHRAARRVEAGYVWINNAGPHFVGAPFGGYKQSGVGREESFEELFTWTQTKNINITL